MTTIRSDILDLIRAADAAHESAVLWVHDYFAERGSHLGYTDALQWVERERRAMEADIVIDELPFSEMERDNEASLEWKWMRGAID